MANIVLLKKVCVLIKEKQTMEIHAKEMEVRNKELFVTFMTH